jgi:hypothetical protein
MGHHILILAGAAILIALALILLATTFLYLRLIRRCGAQLMKRLPLCLAALAVLAGVIVAQLGIYSEITGVRHPTDSIILVGIIFIECAISIVMLFRGVRRPRAAGNSRFT